FQTPEEGRTHQDSMPDVPAPEDCIDLAEAFQRRGGSAEEWEREWAALQVRYAGDSRPGGLLEDPDVPARARLWIKVNGVLPDDPLQHTAAFTYASDMTLLGSTLVPHNTFISAPDVVAASLDHSIWFHQPFRADEWWLYDQHSPSAHGGRGLAIARVFTQDGQLVASVAQEGLIRVTR
ncbi:MAG: acyl-CoA thioesterase II, partial [Myxococcaceae bacterium]